MAFLARLLASLPLLIASPLIMAISALALALTDLVWERLWNLGTPPPKSEIRNPKSLPNSATVVIPNWNGRDLLAKYLPHLEAALSHNPSNEILIVDNGSTDGSADYVRQAFPN